MGTIGRNAPCPCGSGKKYKKCCLAANEQEQLDYARVRSGRDGFQAQFMAYASKAEDLKKVPAEFTEATGLDFEDNNLALFLRWLGAKETENKSDLLSEWRQSATLDEMETAAADGFTNPRCSFFKVDDVKEDLGIETVDLMTKKKLTVNDGPLSRMLQPGDIFSAIMFPVNDVWLIDGTMVDFDPDQEKKLVAQVKKRAKDAERDPKKEADYLSENPFFFHELVHELAKDFASS